MDDLYEDDFEDSIAPSTKHEVHRGQASLDLADELVTPIADTGSNEVNKTESDKFLPGNVALESSQYEEDFYSGDASAFEPSFKSASYENEFEAPSVVSTGENVPTSVLASSLVGGVINTAQLSASQKLSPQKPSATIGHPQQRTNEPPATQGDEAGAITQEDSYASDFDDVEIKAEPDLVVAPLEHATGREQLTAATGAITEEADGDIPHREEQCDALLNAGAVSASDRDAYPPAESGQQPSFDQAAQSSRVPSRQPSERLSNTAGVDVDVDDSRLSKWVEDRCTVVTDASAGIVIQPSTQLNDVMHQETGDLDALEPCAAVLEQEEPLAEAPSFSTAPATARLSARNESARGGDNRGDGGDGDSVNATQGVDHSEPMEKATYTSAPQSGRLSSREHSVRLKGVSASSRPQSARQGSRPQSAKSVRGAAEVAVEETNSTAPGAENGDAVRRDSFVDAGSAPPSGRLSSRRASGRYQAQDETHLEPGTVATAGSERRLSATDIVPTARELTEKSVSFQSAAEGVVSGNGKEQARLGQDSSARSANEEVGASRSGRLARDGSVRSSAAVGATEGTPRQESFNSSAKIATESVSRRSSGAAQSQSAEEGDIPAVPGVLSREGSHRSEAVHATSIEQPGDNDDDIAADEAADPEPTAQSASLDKGLVALTTTGLVASALTAATASAVRTLSPARDTRVASVRSLSPVESGSVEEDGTSTPTMTAVPDLLGLTTTGLVAAALTTATANAVRSLSPQRETRDATAHPVSPTESGSVKGEVSSDHALQVPVAVTGPEDEVTAEAEGDHSVGKVRSSSRAGSAKFDTGALEPAHVAMVSPSMKLLSGFVQTALSAATDKVATALISPSGKSGAHQQWTSTPSPHEGEYTPDIAVAPVVGFDVHLDEQQTDIAVPDAEPVVQQETDGPMVWDEEQNKLVPYAEYCKTHSIGPRPGESKKANQLRDLVSETRGTSRKSKKDQDEADRTFLTSIQYRPTTVAAKLQESPYRRPVSALTASRPQQQQQSQRAAAPVTKRDLLRARSAGFTKQNSRSPTRHDSPSGHQGNKSPGRRRTPSPNRRRTQSAADKRTVFVPPKPCLPSKALPKELADYLFASSRESELKISLFCQHGRHFSSCKADLCVDAHEKYRWLNLVHTKAKEACALVCDADRMWRTKLERGLEEEVEQRKLELEAEVNLPLLSLLLPFDRHGSYLFLCVVASILLQLEGLDAKLKKRARAHTRLLKKGVAFYESVLPAMQRGEITAEELYRATGWTTEHYENFKRRLEMEQERAEVQRKMVLDQQAHKNQEAVNELRNSLTYVSYPPLDSDSLKLRGWLTLLPSFFMCRSPMIYLDGMLRTRLEAIQNAVKRIDLCFQYSIKLAAGIGTAKSEEQLKAEAARSSMKNAIIAERLVRNTKHGFEILKNSLAIIADVCSDVRLMYRGIRRDHDFKHDRGGASSAAKSRSPSPTRPVRPISASGPASRSPTKARPKSAPSTATPQKKRQKSKRAVKSAVVRGSSEAVLDTKLGQGSRVSYAEDFEDDHQYDSAVAEEDDFDADGSVEVREDTYDEEIDEMMRGMGMDEASSRRVSGGSASVSLSRAPQPGSESIAEEVGSEAPSVTEGQRPPTSGGSKKAESHKVDSAEGRPSLALSIGSGIEDELPAQGERMSEKAAVLQKAHELAMSRSASNTNTATGLSRAPSNHNSADEVDSEEEGHGEEEYSDGVDSEGGSDEGDERKGSYDDDFEGDDSLVKGAFGDDAAKGKKKKARRVSAKRKRERRSKKVAELIASDILGVPLAVMAPTQRNQQNVLHGLLLAHNIPLHVEDDEQAVKAAKLKPITVTDIKNRQIPIPLAPSKKSKRKSEKLASGSGRERAEGGWDGRLPSRPTSSVPAARSGDESAELVRCYRCRRRVAAEAAKHLPMQNTANDEVIFERAKRHQRQMGTLFPKFQTIHVSSSAQTQRAWVAQQMEFQEKLLRDGVAQRGSAALHKYDHPFCSWECVKTWAVANCTVQMKYHTEILIDLAAGYSVKAAPELGH